MDEKIEEKVKNKGCDCNKNIKLKIFISLIVALIVFILGILVGFYFLDNGFMEQNDDVIDKCVDQTNDNENDDESNDENNNEDLDELYKSDYDKLLEKINDLRTIEYLNKSFKVDELTNLEMLYFVFDFIDDKYDRDVTLDEVNKISMKYFGKEIKGEDIPCRGNKDIMVFLYDEKNKVFKNNEEHGGHGGAGAYYPTVLNRIVNVDVNNDLYTLSVKKAFAILLTDTGFVTSYYKSYSDAFSGKNELFGFDTEEGDFMEEYGKFYPEVEFNKISSDKLNTYTYVFKKVDDEFIFVSYAFK